MPTFVAVHRLLYDTAVRVLGAAAVDRAPADVALDLATAMTPYAQAGDAVMLAASDPRIADLLRGAAAGTGLTLREAVYEVDAPLAQEIADAGGAGLAIVGPPGAPGVDDAVIALSRVIVEALQIEPS